MKVKVRTKQGGFRDDRYHLTTKWQDVDGINPLWVDSPNIEVMVDGKLLPDSVDVPRPTMTRPEPVEETAVEEPEEDKEPAKKDKT